MRPPFRPQSVSRLLCGAVFFTATIFAAQAAHHSSTAVQPSPVATQIALQKEFPNGPGKQTFLRTCSRCHSPENVFGHGQDADGWTSTLQMMIQYGAQGSNEDFGAIVYYLSNNFGPPPDTVNVNKATVLDLRNWLHFTQQQADAIVRYREQKGDFKSTADLEKVPGISPKMVTTRKVHLIF